MFLHLYPRKGLGVRDNHEFVEEAVTECLMDLEALCKSPAPIGEVPTFFNYSFSLAITTWDYDSFGACL
jgi:hypothetical protein